MSGRSPTGRDPDWVTASDLAEYAYCPRAHYYRQHPADANADPSQVRRATAGTRYHDRRLPEIQRIEVGRSVLGWVAGACVLLLLAGVVWVWA